MAMGSAGADPRDSDLVVAAREGQAWALTEIWQRHAPAVTGYLRGRGASEPDDMTSEVFLAVFERMHGFHGDDEALRSFVFTVAHHKMVDDLRRRSRRGESAAYDPETTPGSRPRPRPLAMDSLGDQQVDELLQTLSPDQREVLLMRVVADLSASSRPAAVLGKRVGAVKALQHRRTRLAAAGHGTGRIPMSPYDDDMDVSGNDLPDIVTMAMARRTLRGLVPDAPPTPSEQLAVVLREGLVVAPAGSGWGRLTGRLASLGLAAKLMLAAGVAVAGAGGAATAVAIAHESSHHGDHPDSPA